LKEMHELCERSGGGAHSYLRVFNAEVLNVFLLRHVRVSKGLTRSVLFKEICIWIICFSVTILNFQPSLTRSPLWSVNYV